MNSGCYGARPRVSDTREAVRIMAVRGAIVCAALALLLAGCTRGAPARRGTVTQSAEQQSQGEERLPASETKTSGGTKAESAQVTLYVADMNRQLKIL